MVRLVDQLMNRVRGSDTAAVRAMLAVHPRLAGALAGVTPEAGDMALLWDDLRTRYGWEVSRSELQRHLRSHLCQNRVSDASALMKVVCPDESCIDAIVKTRNGTLAMRAVESLFRHGVMTPDRASRILCMSPGCWNDRLVHACVAGGASGQSLSVALHLSAMLADDVTFEALLADSADVRSAPFGCSIMFSAAVASSFSPKIFDALLRRDQSPLAAERFGSFTPLHAAAYVANNETLAFMWSHVGSLRVSMLRSLRRIAGMGCADGFRASVCKKMLDDAMRP
jgi:hypothetical protein